MIFEYICRKKDTRDEIKHKIKPRNQADILPLNQDPPPKILYVSIQRRAEREKNLNAFVYAFEHK